MEREKDQRELELKRGKGDGRGRDLRRKKGATFLKPHLFLLTHSLTAKKTRIKNTTTNTTPLSQRWVRVSKDKNEEAGGKYTSARWEEGGATRVQPKSGSEYTVWPVVHALLTERGLDDVDAEEALRLQQAGKAIIVDCRPTYQVKREEKVFSLSFVDLSTLTSKLKTSLSLALPLYAP